MESVNGNMSAREFAAGVKLFTEISDRLGEGWILVDEEGDDEGIYMKKTVVRHLRLDQRCSQVFSDDPCEGTYDVESDDDCSIAPELPRGSDHSERSWVCTWEYHVLYSPSYQVPVLYFNAQRQNGALLSLEEVWLQVPAVHATRMRHDPWSALTQQEHPLLARPFYQLHPCRTAPLMGGLSALWASTGEGVGRIDPECTGQAYVGDPEWGEGLAMGDTWQGCTGDAGRVEASLVGDIGQRGLECPDGVKHVSQSCIEVKTDQETVSTGSSPGQEGAGVTEDKERRGRALVFKYLVSWLSSIGPVVQLELPLQFATAELP